MDTAARLPDVAQRMADAAQRWLDALDPAQRESANFPFLTDERRAWDYRPGPRQGLMLNDMRDEQRGHAIALIDTGLSLRGARQVRAIMALEVVLGEIEHAAGTSKWVRDPLRYWFAVFGEPRGVEPWAWRVGGHHVAVQLTVVDRQFVAATPLFLGANPAQVPHGPHAGSRALPEEEDLARELLARLDAPRKAIAIVDAAAPDDILTKNYRTADRDSVPAGIAFARLDGIQREALVRLIRHYVERATPEVAAVEWRRIEAAGLDTVTFAWAGPEARGHGHYYAVRGPRFMIEYDNTQNGANHIHSVWRDFSNDWGGDWLAAHYAAGHQ